MDTVDNRSFKQKIHDAKVKVQVKVETAFNNVKRIIQDHPDETLALACVAVPVIGKVANSAIRCYMQGRETRYNECDIYDPKTSTHYYTKRPLSNKQKLNLEAAYNAGRSKGEILKEMRLI